MHHDTSPPVVGAISGHGAASNGSDKHRQNELREFITPRKFQRFAK